MKRNEKTNVLTVAVKTSTDQADANKSVLNVEKIEEAQLQEAEQLKQQIKPNLVETMKIIDLLHQKTRQRNKLEVYTDMLAQFSITQDKEDYVEGNFYNGCNLIIMDDNRDKFELRHPVLIREVVQYLMQRFTTKIAEIEAEIVLP